MKVETPWDKEGADILLIHNAGEIMAWPENPAPSPSCSRRRASAGRSAEVAGYDASTTACSTTTPSSPAPRSSTPSAAKKLGVKKIVLGECGHAHKALTVIADRVLTGDLNIPRESALTRRCEDIVR
jgi:hypothetical protein